MGSTDCSMRLNIFGWAGLAVLIHSSVFSSEVRGATVSAGVPRSLFISAEINQGTAALSNAVPDETDSSGSQTEILALASWRLDSWIFEFGGGWFHNTISGSAEPSGFGVHQYKVVTQAGVVEVSPQYRITSHWQLGPVAEFLFGDDVGFNPGFGKRGQSTAWLAGLQSLYEFHLGQVALRPGVRYLVSLNVANHVLQSIQATFQLGLPIY